MQLEQTLEQEQEQQVSKLMKKIEKLEKDTMCKQGTLEQVTVTFFNLPLHVKDNPLR